MWVEAIKGIKGIKGVHGQCVTVFEREGVKVLMLCG